MSKYKRLVDEMLKSNKDQFTSFKEIHDKFTKNPNEYKNQFNDIGRDTLQIIRKWENILCAKSEGGKYSKFSTNLSEKFWIELRTLFPLIDKVGELN